MSFFAVLESGQSHKPNVVDCHLNVWSLGGLFGYRPTIFDVGLKLEATENKDVSEFKLVIPFGTQEGSLTDLRDKLTNQEDLDLIFSGSATLNTEGTTTIKYGEEWLVLAHIDTDGSKRISEISDEQISVWRIKLEDPVVHGTPIYVRLRFQVDSLGRTWTWRRSAFAKNGALIDFRVGDARGTNTSDRTIKSKHILPIGTLYLFIVAPAWLALRTASPDLHYIRLLEGRPWWNYLDLATNLLRDEKLAIYQWRKTNVGRDNEAFHSFLDLSRHSPLPTLVILARSSLILLSLGGLVWLIVTKGEQAVQYVTSHLVALGVGGFVLFLYALSKESRHIRKLRSLFRNGFHETVKFFLSIRKAM